MVRDEKVKEFGDAAISLHAKAEIAHIYAEELAAGTDRKLITDALMGTALDQIKTRDGMVGRKVYLRMITDQIEKALSWYTKNRSRIAIVVPPVISGKRMPWSHFRELGKRPEH